MAILPETAIRWAKAQGDPHALQEAVRQRLLAESPLLIGDGRLDEFAEDVVTALLEIPDLEDDIRVPIVRGWHKAYQISLAILTDRFIEEPERAELTKPFLRVFRIAELTGNDDLREAVRAALPLVIGNDRIPAYLVQQVVAAAMSYPDDLDWQTWKRALEQEAIAGLAFLALLRIDAQSAEIADCFYSLMERQFIDGWNIDVWFLGEYVRTYAGSTEALEQAIRAFSVQWPDAWATLQNEPDDNPCWPADVIMKLVEESGAPPSVRKANQPGGSASA